MAPSLIVFILYKSEPVEYNRGLVHKETHHLLTCVKSEFALRSSHRDWKTWKNGKAFSSQGKVGEFL